MLTLSATGERVLAALLFLLGLGAWQLLAPPVVGVVRVPALEFLSHLAVLPEVAREGSPGELSRATRLPVPGRLPVDSPGES